MTNKRTLKDGSIKIYDAKKYYDKFKQNIDEKQFNCDLCECVVSYYAKSSHLKTKKHLLILSKMEKLKNQ
jgi:hypothetical protein